MPATVDRGLLSWKGQPVTGSVNAPRRVQQVSEASIPLVEPETQDEEEQRQDSDEKNDNRGLEATGGDSQMGSKQDQSAVRRI